MIMEAKKITKKVLTGVVVSDKMDKTIVIKVEVNAKHPLYGKIIKRSQRVKAHDERNECNVGDLVKIIECRPLSRDKRWRLSAIVERAK